MNDEEKEKLLSLVKLPYPHEFRVIIANINEQAFNSLIFAKQSQNFTRKQARAATLTNLQNQYEKETGHPVTLYNKTQYAFGEKLRENRLAADKPDITLKFFVSLFGGRVLFDLFSIYFGEKKVDECSFNDDIKRFLSEEITQKDQQNKLTSHTPNVNFFRVNIEDIITPIDCRPLFNSIFMCFVLFALSFILFCCDYRNLLSCLLGYYMGVVFACLGASFCFFPLIDFLFCASSRKIAYISICIFFISCPCYLFAELRFVFYVFLFAFLVAFLFCFFQTYLQRNDFSPSY